MARVPLSPRLDRRFVERWSPVSFSSQPVDPRDLDAVLEAARWAPSSNNDQPWLFVVADRPETVAAAREVLVAGNRRWADRAPVLVLVFARKLSRRNGTANRWGAFDTGAAWMSLALQARALGLVTHAMGGFSAEQALALAGQSADTHEPMCVVALGHPGDGSELPEDLLVRQQPNGRLELPETIRRLGEP
jgi:nitroreductase